MGKVIYRLGELIKELGGPTKAAAFFGVSAATMSAWRHRSGHIPAARYFEDQKRLEKAGISGHPSLWFPKSARRPAEARHQWVEPVRVLDLFSGIGGFALGLERTGGFETVAFCELEPYCRKVLQKHWPDVQSMTTLEPLLPLDLPQTELPLLWSTPNTLDAMPGRTRKQLAEKSLNGHWGSALNTGNLRDAVLTSSPAASPARTSHLPERGLALRASAAAYGANTPDLLGRFDPDTPSLRTSQRCLFEGLSVFSGTWPRSGMMRNGTAYRLPTLAPLTAGTGYGSSPTHSIPTPTTQDHIERRCTSTEMLNFETNKSVSLDRFVRRFPTPTSRDWKDGTAESCATCR